MRILMLIVFALGFASWRGGEASQAGKAAAPAMCSFCKSRGSIPCDQHSKSEIEREQKVEHCTVAIGCKKCGGVFEVDCDKCSLADDRLKKARDEKQRWIATLAKHFEAMGRPVRVVQSKHFELTWEAGRAVVGKTTISEHEAVHLYAERCEALFADFMATLGVEESAFSTRFRVILTDREKDHIKASSFYCGQGNPDSSVKRMGAVGNLCLFLDPAKIDPDENAGAELHRAVIHHTTHLLLSNAWDHNWPGETQGGWIDEGIAHYFEDKLDKRCTNFCYREQDTSQSFKGGRWRGPVKQLAISSTRPPFADTATKRTEELTLEEHALVWSYCEFLIAQNGKGLGQIAKAVKAGRGYRDALKEQFGFNALSFEEAWKKHVKSYGK